MAGPGDDLFLALAQAKAQPSHALRAVKSAGETGQDLLGGYLKGRQIRAELDEPGALERVFASTPQGAEIEKNIGAPAFAQALYGLGPKEGMNYLGKTSQLAQARELGLAGINERNTASKRAADAANSRTNAQKEMFGGKNLSSNISLHENEIARLSNEQTRLASTIPGGIGGTIQNLISQGGNFGPYLQDPKFGGVVRQMAQNAQEIKRHQAFLEPLYRAQGQIPQGLLDNSDLNSINPPPLAGGDNSIVTGLPGFGD